ncbi:phenylacetate--CoA ligase [Ottowia sp.]|uniref:phenylacetate--CoA ligase family protein n=1 Tax=Ottowia sp. TaxID=1898956 RepID=UPI002D1660AC|nr:phenylacetate--CoA ligase [Ottowia sp.]HRN75044.1 phenylacetate--CoA ligase [Ottowia sp.]HRQ02148.1 phenylacetate--CoA ligase [Ottowia sp.]
MNTHSAEAVSASPVGLHPQIESMPREQLRDLQLQRLRETLANLLANVPWQRERLREAGFSDAQDLQSLDDVQRLPFNLKTDLRDHYPFGLFARPQQQLARIHASSGTTGKPTVVGYTAGDLNRWADLVARSLHCAGVRSGDLVHNAYGYGLFTGGLGAHDGATRLGCPVVPVSGGSSERQIGLIMDFRPRVLCATPSYALTLAEVAEQMGIDLRGSGLGIGMFGAEPWSAEMRAEIETRIGLRAVDIYGLSEIMGPGVACECECRNGLHGWEDQFLFEVIDRDTGLPLPDGEVGELVITTLTKEALPMLRYRTRDVTRVTRERCDCGRTHVRILRVTGRTDDMLIIRGVNVYPSHIEAVLVGRPGIAPHYELTVRREGTLDTVAVSAEAQPGIPEASYPELAKELSHHIKSMIGISTRVTVVPPGSIARSEGKAVRVRDLRPKEGAAATLH